TDTTFSPQISAEEIPAVALQPDGKILLFQYSYLNADPATATLVRLLPDGGLDEGFVPAVPSDVYIESMVVQPDGRILLASPAFQLPGGIVRLNPDGSLDASFKVDLGSSGLIRQIVLEKSGRILVDGWFETEQRSLLRLNPDGSIDGNFDAYISGPS